MREQKVAVKKTKRQNILSKKPDSTTSSRVGITKDARVFELLLTNKSKKSATQGNARTKIVHLMPIEDRLDPFRTKKRYFISSNYNYYGNLNLGNFSTHSEGIAYVIYPT